MTFNINDYKTVSTVVEVETETGYMKRYELIDNEFELVSVEDENGEVSELTSIPNFSRYKANLDKGIVWSEVSDRWLDPKPNKRFGYCYSTLKDDSGKTTPISMHVLMMSAHTGMRSEEWKPLTVNHKNFQKDDNSIGNLELIEHRDQFCDVVRSKMGQGERLSNEDVRYLRMIKAVLEAKGEYKQNDFCNYFSEKLDRSYTTIENIVNNRTYTEIQLSEKELEMINKIRLQHDLEKFDVAI